ncbi:MAG: OmpA family protein [gamma proteobacterium symbiont of Taylorina sp.]|nr:OmpA family protein [gamma proteobacterium symbiont of Taylorina sp.]
MAIKKLLTVSAIGLAMGIVSATAIAGDGFVKEYVTNSAGEVWKNSYGECWRDRFASTDVKLEECGYEKPMEAPAPVVVATTAPCPDIIVLKNLHFDFDSTAVHEADKEQLSAARDFIRANVPAGCHKTETVDVVGHTDSVGAEAYNDTLSLERAEAVISYLRSIGVEVPLNAVGKGELEPTADNSTKEGRAQNRRVVIDINTSN